MIPTSQLAPVGQTAVLAGVPVDDVTLEDAVRRCCELVERGRATGCSHQVTTVNVDFLRNAMRDPAVRRILQWSDLAIPDGMPVVWASRLLGTPLRQRVAGADLVPALAGSAAQRGHLLYLYGGAPGVAEEAAARLAADHPGARVVGAGGSRFIDIEDMDRAAIEGIRAARPDIVCVALGHPKQERWIDAYRDQIGAPVLVGVGGSLDFLVGRTRRAPRWMQRAGLEWLHRVLTEPRRLAGRYARDLLLFPALLAREIVATPPGAAPAQGLEGRLSSHGASLLVDVSGLDRLDRGTVGTLVREARGVRARGGQVFLTGLSSRARRTLRALRVEGYFQVAEGVEIAPTRRRSVLTESMSTTRPRRATARIVGAPSPGRSSDRAPAS